MSNKFLSDVIINLKALQNYCLSIVQNSNFVDYENERILKIIPSVQNLIIEVEHLTELYYIDDKEE